MFEKLVLSLFLFNTLPLQSATVIEKIRENKEDWTDLIEENGDWVVKNRRKNNEVRFINKLPKNKHAPKEINNYYAKVLQHIYRQLFHNKLYKDGASLILTYLATPSIVVHVVEERNNNQTSFLFGLYNFLTVDGILAGVEANFDKKIKRSKIVWNVGGVELRGTDSLVEKGVKDGDQLFLCVSFSPYFPHSLDFALFYNYKVEIRDYKVRQEKGHYIELGGGVNVNGTYNLEGVKTVEERAKFLISGDGGNLVDRKSCPIDFESKCVNIHKSVQRVFNAANNKGFQRLFFEKMLINTYRLFPLAYQKSLGDEVRGSRFDKFVCPCDQKDLICNICTNPIAPFQTIYASKSLASRMLVCMICLASYLKEKDVNDENQDIYVVATSDKIKNIPEGGFRVFCQNKRKCLLQSYKERRNDEDKMKDNSQQPPLKPKTSGSSDISQGGSSDDGDNRDDQADKSSSTPYLLLGSILIGVPIVGFLLYPKRKHTSKKAHA